jgi:hypothetical protein
MKLLFTYNKVKAFDITKNGAQVIDHEGKIQVYNDPFCSIPLYITNDLNGEIIVFSDFENFYSNDSIVKDIDEVGFWEIVFFGSQTTNARIHITK